MGLRKRTVKTDLWRYNVLSRKEKFCSELEYFEEVK